MRLGHRQHRQRNDHVKTPWERQPSASQGEESRKKSTLPTPHSLSGPPELWEKTFLMRTPPVWGILLWQPRKVIHCPSFKDQLKCRSGHEIISHSQISPPSVLLLLLLLCHSASFRITFAHTSPCYVVTSWEWSPCLIHFFPLQHFSLRRPGGLNEWLLK